MYYCFETPVGPLVLCEADGKITKLRIFCDKDADLLKKEPTPLMKNAENQLNDYFAGKRKNFELPLYPNGTAFQRQVWSCLQSIPYGETRSYGEIAKAIDNSKAARAVGMANHNNPIMIMIPCHRVVGANGSLTGYAGGLHMKETLLRLEKKHA